MKGLGISSRDGQQHILGDLLKFFPIAYFVVFSSSEGLEMDVPYITGGGCTDINCQTELYLDLYKFPSAEWPEFQRTSKFYTLMPYQPAIVGTPKAIGRANQKRSH